MWNVDVIAVQFSSVQSLSRVRLSATTRIAVPARPPVHHQLPEFAQTHVHGVGDANQPSHRLSSPSPPALNLSQNGLPRARDPSVPG